MPRIFAVGEGAAGHSADNSAADEDSWFQIQPAFDVGRKAARLRYLKDRWARRLAEDPPVKILTSFDPKQSCGIGFFSVEGLDPGKLGTYL